MEKKWSSKTLLPERSGLILIGVEVSKGGWMAGDADRLPFSLLIRFRLRNGDSQALRAETQIFQPHAYEFRAAERAGKADQQQRPIARGAQITRYRP
jgi:hypothetical protein